MRPNVVNARPHPGSCQAERTAFPQNRRQTYAGSPAVHPVDRSPTVATGQTGDPFHTDSPVHAEIGRKKARQVTAGLLLSVWFRSA